MTVCLFDSLMLLRTPFDRFFYHFASPSMWPDWAIYCTLDNFSKPVATIIFPKSHTFFGNFCNGVKIFHISSEIIFGAPFIDIWWLFLLVMLISVVVKISFCFSIWFSILSFFRKISTERPMRCERKEAALRRCCCCPQTRFRHKWPQVRGQVV